MSKLSKNKRDKLKVLVTATVCVLAAIWFLFIQPEQAALKTKRNTVVELGGKVRAVKRNVEMAGKFKNDLQLVEDRVGTFESKMAAGDVYRWLVRAFPSQASNNIEITALEPPHLTDPIILPRVAYKAALFKVTGTAYYHDFGKYLANLENAFPHMRLTQLEMEPAHLGEAVAEEDEKLTFIMEMLTLIKPATTPNLR